MIRTALGLAFVTLLLAVPAWTAAVARADDPVAPAATGVTQDTRLGQAITLTTREQTVLALINRARSSRGLHTLVLSRPLYDAAVAHCREMLGREYFSHYSYSGESPSSRLVRFGYSRTGYTRWRVGEVIGWGAGTRGTPRAIFKVWMGSRTHRSVILDPGWRDIGVGVRTNSFAGLDGVRMYTVDFGRRVK